MGCNLTPGRRSGGPQSKPIRANAMYIKSAFYCFGAFSGFPVQVLIQLRYATLHCGLSPAIPSAILPINAQYHLQLYHAYFNRSAPWISVLQAPNLPATLGIAKFFVAYLLFICITTTKDSDRFGEETCSICKYSFGNE
jgi:hypothetical protein